jgi:hypothetical protein
MSSASDVPILSLLTRNMATMSPEDLRSYVEDLRRLRTEQTALSVGLRREAAGVRDVRRLKTPPEWAGRLLDDEEEKETT